MKFSFWVRAQGQIIPTGGIIWPDMKFFQSRSGFPWSLLFPVPQILSKMIKKITVKSPSQIKAKTDFWPESVWPHCYQRQYVRRTEKIATLTCFSTALEKKTFKRAACFYSNPGLDSVKCHDLTSAPCWSAAGKSILVGRHRGPLSPSAIRCLAGAGSVTSCSKFTSESSFVDPAQTIKGAAATTSACKIPHVERWKMTCGFLWVLGPAGRSFLAVFRDFSLCTQQFVEVVKTQERLFA